MSEARPVIGAMLERRLDGRAADWLEQSRAELEGGVDDTRFASLIALASRHAPRRALEPSAGELAAADAALEGWNPERWSCLDALRAALVLARPDLAGDTFAAALEDTFRYADEGELRALYRCLCLLPAGERFLWRAAEGCRSNIVPVFEAVACDNPYPVRHFDDVAWNQLAIKAVFIGAPLNRVFGLDGRLSPELARMALDLAEERRSAGRPVQPELWLCLGTHGGERGLAALEQELKTTHILGRRAAALALARAGEPDHLQRLAETESDPEVALTMRRALAGEHDQGAFAALDPTP